MHGQGAHHGGARATAASRCPRTGRASLDDLERFDHLPAVLKPSVGGGGSANLSWPRTGAELRLRPLALERLPGVHRQAYVGTPAGRVHRRRAARPWTASCSTRSPSAARSCPRSATASRCPTAAAAPDSARCSPSRAASRRDDRPLPGGRRPVRGDRRAHSARVRPAEHPVPRGGRRSTSSRSTRGSRAPPRCGDGRLQRARRAVRKLWARRSSRASPTPRHIARIVRSHPCPGQLAAIRDK